MLALPSLSIVSRPTVPGVTCTAPHLACIMVRRQAKTLAPMFLLSSAFLLSFTIVLHLRILHLPLPSCDHVQHPLFLTPRENSLLHPSIRGAGQQRMSDRKQIWRRLLPKSGSPYDGQELASNEIRLITIKSISKASKSPEWWVSATAKMKYHGREITQTPPDISVELQTHRHELTKDLDYDAISYVWGAAPASVKIMCNKKPLLITSTALQMLQYLHRHQKNGRRRRIWIDAICINQEDKEEKRMQIPLMRGIYSRAASVIVWMGPSTLETDVFFAELQEVRRKSKHWMALDDGNSSCRGPIAAELPLDVYAFFEGLTQLLRNEWFTRLWIYQEISLPPRATLLCGETWVDFDVFLDFIIRGYFRSTYILRVWNIGINAEISTSADTCYFIDFLRNTTSPRKQTKMIESQNVAMNLYQLRRRHVKEPVDRVWAIVGLLQSDLRDELSPEVDYSEPGRVEYWKTWIVFAKALMNGPGGMNLLNVPPTLEPGSAYLPSWCPELSGRSSCSMIIHGQWNMAMGRQPTGFRWALSEEDSDRKSAERFKAIKSHKMIAIDTVKHDDLLRIRGFVLDRIVEVVDHERVLDIAYHTYDQNSEEQVALYDIAVVQYMECLSLARRVFYGKNGDVTDVPDDVIMALFLDCRMNEETRNAYRETMPKLASWYSKTNVHASWKHSQCQKWLTTIRGHTFFSTKGGRIGYAHPGCKPGDQVATFYGGEPLYIIRQLNQMKDDIDSTGQASAHIQYMGAAFIPHLMEQRQRDAARMGPDTLFMIH